MILRTLIWTVGIFLLLLSETYATSLKVAVIPTMRHGGFLLMSNVVDHLSTRGHTATVFISDSFVDQCSIFYGPNAHCVPYHSPIKSWMSAPFFDSSNFVKEVDSHHDSVLMSSSGNQPVAAALWQAINELQHTFDVFVVDVENYGADHVAHLLGVPSVLLWSNTSFFSEVAERNMRGAAYGKKQSPFIVRLGNYLADFLEFGIAHPEGSDKRIQPLGGNGEPPRKLLSYLYYNRHNIVPGIPGYDIPDIWCPNIYPVGFLMHRASRLMYLPSSWSDWMDHCENGVMFSDIGFMDSLSAYDLDVVTQAAELVNSKYKMCVLWLVGSSNAGVKNRFQNTHGSIRVVDQHFASQNVILGHRTTRLYFTVCHSSYIHDAIAMETPIIALSIPGYRHECERITRAPIGATVSVQNLSSQNIMHAIECVYTNATIMHGLWGISRLGYLMTGVSKAIEVIELSAALGKGNADFFCESESVDSRYLVEILIVVGAFVAVLAKLVACMLCSRRRHQRVCSTKKDD